jgi:hypothetical protein
MSVKKTVVVLEHIWNNDAVSHNKDISVLPYIDGICRFNDYELFYGKYIDGTGFNAWIEHFKNILRDKERRIVIYLAGHGSNRTFGGKNLDTLLLKVWESANHLNVEGCILGGCFIGQNEDDMKFWMTESNLTWIMGYKYEIDWLSSTFLDMSIISSALSTRQDHLNDPDKLKFLLSNGANLFNSGKLMSIDSKKNQHDFLGTVTCIIQPRRQGQKPTSIPLFDE